MPPSASPLNLRAAAGAAAFLTLGVLQAVYGPAFPLFEAKYAVGAAGVGLIVSLHFVGSASAPLLVGSLITRWGLGKIVGLALLLLAAGALLVAFAPNWPLALFGALLGGLGLGGVSASLNAAYARVGTGAVNFVNALFGAGSMLAPLLVLSGQLPVVFGVIAMLAVVSLGAARVWGFPPLAAEPARPAGRQGRVVGLFAAILLLYVGIEVGTGAWAGRVLAAGGVTEPALIVSGYWGGLTLSRVGISLLRRPPQPERLVLTSALLLSGALSLTLLPGLALAPVAYLLAGVACGPIFPTLLAWLSAQVPARVVSSVLVAGSAGGVLMPWLLGQASSLWGVGAISLTLALSGMGLSLLVWAAARGARPGA